MSDRPEPRHGRPPSGEPVSPLPPGLWPARVAHEGKYVRVEPLDIRVHAEELYAASHVDEALLQIWDYLSSGPYPNQDAFRTWLRDCSASADPIFFAVRDAQSGQARGMAAYLNVHPKAGTIEIGHIWFSPALQRTPAATEALYLLLRHALDDLGYRRMEWKCNALNQASRRAAVRLGFSFEGIFYQHMIVKGRNRDTAWFAILDTEWPRLRANIEAWLSPDNFDEAGHQRTSLSRLNLEGR
ncbi:MAG: GNAT family N-acetyltransferase [Chloroflexota bacterium]|nr:GNAT family N-acetyltransferase [Chloroflexota bacterium]